MFFLTNPLGRLLAGAAAGALLLGLVYTKGHGDGSGAEKKAEAVREAAAEKLAAQQTAQAQQVASQADTQAQAVRTQIVNHTQTIIKRIPYEIPAASDPLLSANWVRDYNESLLPQGAGPSAQSGPATGGTPSAVALEGIVANNGTCVATAAQLSQLIDFYGKMRLKVNGKP